MIYDFDHRFIFLHIPRTAGESIEWGLVATCPNAVAHVYEWRHIWGRSIVSRLPELRRGWGSLRKFAVIRNPWDLIASQYRHITQSAARMTPRTRLTCTAGWIDEMKRVAAYGSFERFVDADYLRAHRYIRPGGFWSTWCEGALGEGIGVRPIRFDDLVDEWPKVCDSLLIPRFRLPHRNASQPEPVNWTQGLIDRIGELCCHDVVTFGFKPPTI